MDMGGGWQEGGVIQFKKGLLGNRGEKCFACKGSLISRGALWDILYQTPPLPLRYCIRPPWMDASQLISCITKSPSPPSC